MWRKYLAEFLPGDFTVPQYRELQKKLGLERVIVVQPNAYADDNTVTLNAMKELGKGAKGVAVVKPDVKEAELERLTKAGICAVRIMTLHGAMLGFDVMDAAMKRVHPYGWHPNIQLDGRDSTLRKQRKKARSQFWFPRPEAIRRGRHVSDCLVP